MMANEPMRIEVALTGAKTDLDDLYPALEELGLTLEALPITPLHMGGETATIVLTLIGTAASLGSAFASLWDRRRKFDIEVKPRGGDTILLRKTSPWTIQDLRRILRIEA